MGERFLIATVLSVVLTAVVVPVVYSLVRYKGLERRRQI